jgi:hypothetical protein
MHNLMSYGLFHSWVENYKPHDFPCGLDKYRKINVEKRRQWRETFGKMHWKNVDE